MWLISEELKTVKYILGHRGYGSANLEGNGVNMNISYERQQDGVKHLSGKMTHPYDNGEKPSALNGRVESSDNSMLMKLNDDDNGIGSPNEVNGNHERHCCCLSPSVEGSPSNCDVCRTETPEKHLNNLGQPCPCSLGDERCSSPDPSSSFLHNSPVLTGYFSKRKLSRVCSAPCLTRSWSSDTESDVIST